MTSKEFEILTMLEGDAQRQGLVPRGTTVKRLKQLLYDEGFGEVESFEVTQHLRAMQLRKLVIATPPLAGEKGKLWMPTAYGRNVVSA